MTPPEPILPEATPLSRETVRAIIDGDELAAQKLREAVERLTTNERTRRMSERKVWKEVGKQIPPGLNTPRLHVWCLPLQSWLERCDDWPEPRDVKTDPPTEKDFPVLALYRGRWGVYGGLGDCTHWLPLPPMPAPPKSEADVAWERHRERQGLKGECLNLKSLFIAGYETRQKEEK